MESAKSKASSEDLVLSPFMPRPKAKQVVEEDDEKKKRKKRFFWIFFMVSFVTVAFGAIGVGLYLRYQETVVYMISLTIDPMVIDARGETHVGGGAYSFNDTESAEHYLTDLEVMLSYNQYFVYKCTITNKSSNNLDMSFEVSSDQKENCLLSYTIDEQPEAPYDQKVENISIQSYQKIVLYVFIKIDDMDQNAYIKGQLSINISEVGG